MMDRKPAIIFDGDDTLWKTQPIYKAVFDEFYQLLARAGFDPQEARLVFAEVNQHLETTMHMSDERIRRAMYLTYEQLLQQAQAQGSKMVRAETNADQFSELADEIYLRLPEPMQDLHTVLARLAEDFDLYLYSGGKDSIQRERVDRLGLAQFFGDRITVVTRKDQEALRQLLTTHDLAPKATWIVGNSPRFEINPGLRLGLHTVWLCTDFWQRDLEDIAERRTCVAFTLPEIVDIVHAPAHPVSAKCAAWLVGTSPKHHINPAIRKGFMPIWIPFGFTSAEVEPIRGQIFVAFSQQGARQIITRWPNVCPEPCKVLWEVRENAEDEGRSMIVE